MITQFKSSVVISFTVLFAVVGAVVFASPQETQIQKPIQPVKPNRADDTRLYMRAKLASSQKVMEGLVSENYKLIQDGASQMKEISEAAHWPTTVDQVYQHYSVEFRRQCDKLKEQAALGDLQAAHYTFLHLSTTCIDCHNYVRPRFKVKHSKLGAPVQLIPTHWDSKTPGIQTPQPDDEKKDKTG
jgi:hypothetical protein